MEILVEKFFITEYDYITCIQAKCNKMKVISINTSSADPETISDCNDFRGISSHYTETFIIPSQRERARKFMNLDNILSDLDHGRRHVDSFTLQLPSGFRYKKLAFFYIDKESQLIGMVRTDFTEVQEQQLIQEQKLLAALKAAQQASLAKSNFLSRMSHDIRTPLNGIIGMTYLAAEQDNPPETCAYLEKIATSSKFLLGLINDILDMTKVENDKIKLHPEPYHPAEFKNYLEAVILPLCQEKNQYFKFSVDCPENWIPLYDKLHLNQIIFNLLSNAVKFTPEGGTISYHAVNKLLPDGRMSVQVEVGDTGIGMSPAFMQTLFEPFAQENRKDNSQTQGTGLGLAITKKLLEKMGGTIRMESKLRHGTKFILNLISDCIPATVAAAMPVTPARAADFSILPGKHILLCEDHPLNQQIAKALLEKKGMLVTIAENGQLGLQAFQDSALHFYAAILMDIRMPVLDGYQTTKALRSLSRADAKNVPIIAMTANAFAEDIEKSLDCGMNAHLSKPIEPIDLYRILSNLIS